jgi:hypothetical protein
MTALFAFAEISNDFDVLRHSSFCPRAPLRTDLWSLVALTFIGMHPAGIASIYCSDSGLLTVSG